MFGFVVCDMYRLCLELVVCDMYRVCLELVVYELKTFGWKCCVGCEIPTLCGLKLLRTLRMKPLDVD